MITESEARDIAGAWHGGQRSPLYAFSSSGMILNSGMVSASGEVCDLLMPPNLTSEQRAELQSLLAYLEANEPDSEDWFD